MVLNFWHERNKRLAKARAEGYAEGYAEGLAEVRAEMRAKRLAEGLREVHAAWSAWNRRREEAEKRGERFDEPPLDLNAR